jgi:hypothetical protein
MEKINLNKLQLNDPLVGNQQVQNILNKMVTGGNILPKPVSYRDIDREMIKFVTEVLEITHDGKIVPTYFFTQQRFSEFSKTWEQVDENKNVQSNLKIITRENNPKKGTAHQEYWNIPGNSYYTIGTAEKFDGKNKISISYKMKQPYCVDFTYEVKLITNKMDLLNTFNNKVIDTFKSRQSYINPESHFMTVSLEDVSDESDYDLDERKIFVQTFTFEVNGYIINESDLLIEENITRALIGIETDLTKPNVNTFNPNENLIITFPRKSKNIISFKASDYYSVTSVDTTNGNILDYSIQINGTDVIGTTFEINKYDKISIKINRINQIELSKIIFIK